MFKYNELSYSDKIIKLMDFHKNIGKLSDYMEVSRGSITNWKEDDTNLKEANKFKIDMAYCEAFGFETINADELNNMYDELAKIDFSYFSVDEEQITQGMSRISAFGSLEIEEAGITKKKFDKVANTQELIHNLEQREFLSIKNLVPLNDSIVNRALKGEMRDVSAKNIKDWHLMLMSGIRADAGNYSTKIRIIPGSEELHLTDPRDIPEEMEYWVEKYADIKTITDIAKAHAHFESIHPFGDGNGRIGRMIMSIHAINIGLIPPMINKQNKALYLVFLKHAQVNSEYGHLSYFIGQSILDMHKKFFDR